MKCPKCGKQRLITESTSPDGKVERVKCQECGFSENRDKRGCRMLTEVMPEKEPQLLLG